ncbi:MAG: low-specificity L-threonine aldolase [Candidatus Viridilinea halotolerans]|uniref:Low-specificity L-threonine aldolase n=1 Tax=Candidatus Viridilinea halotolerans TaxID=2491704 RepID=A0A426TSM1_9CHLR|nr:MAG: low-specificity L-threonine aldolase [Candidatus Viridilinea halotolerans]
MIDLRSDTVTLPSPAMRAALSHAAVGDDVYGEDPTVNELEALAAAKVGKAAALLVPSGTMGNLIALLAHGARGQRVVCGDESHVYHYEAGGASALGGLVYHTLPTARDGTLPLDRVRAALQPEDDIHGTAPGVFCLENTHNRCGGTALTPQYLADAHAITCEMGVPLHLDGARIFNAALAVASPVEYLTEHVDTVQFCLSKGLAAPVGSLLAGPTPFIARALRVRKMLGGGMRQAGIIAAAGIVALNTMVERLGEDHVNAYLLAAGLAEMPAIRIELDRVHTNIVRFQLADAQASVGEFLAQLRDHGILMGGMGGPTIRAVTHYGIDRAAIEQTLAAVQAVLAPSG